MVKASIVLVSLSTFCIIVISQDPEIVGEIRPEVKPIGGTAYLNCTVANVQTEKVAWEHRERNLVISINSDIDVPSVYNPIEEGKSKYEIEKRGPDNFATYMLTIRRLRQQDAGRYVCYIKIQALPYNHWPSKIGSLTVKVPPSIVANGTTDVLVVDEGSNANLTCSVTGIPTPNITWTRGYGMKLPTGVFLFRGSVLPLVGITLKMAGVYRCVASNGIKPIAQHLAEVIVSNGTIRQDAGGQTQSHLQCKESLKK